MRRKMNRKKAVSVSVISGADGPTSIFLAGKIKKRSKVRKLVMGLLVLVAAIWLVMERWKRNKYHARSGSDHWWIRSD